MELVGYRVTEVVLYSVGYGRRCLLKGYRIARYLDNPAGGSSIGDQTDYFLLRRLTTP